MFTIEAAKKYIESDFDGVFMAITELLPESLMLLRQKMGWSLQDMLYTHLLDACKVWFILYNLRFIILFLFFLFLND